MMLAMKPSRSSLKRFRLAKESSKFKWVHLLLRPIKLALGMSEFCTASAETTEEPISK